MRPRRRSVGWGWRTAGWGAVLTYDGHEKDLCGGEALTTNNRMELMGAISALEAGHAVGRGYLELTGYDRPLSLR